MLQLIICPKLSSRKINCLNIVVRALAPCSAKKTLLLCHSVIHSFHLTNSLSTPVFRRTRLTYPFCCFQVQNFDKPPQPQVWSLFGCLEGIYPWHLDLAWVSRSWTEDGAYGKDFIKISSEFLSFNFFFPIEDWNNLIALLFFLVEIVSRFVWQVQLL